MITIPYTGANKIVDLLEVGGGQQVMLRVKFAEVSKQAEESLGFNFGGNDGTSIYGGNVGANTLGIVPGSAGPPPTPNLLAIPAGALARRACLELVRSEPWRLHILSTPWKRTACCAHWRSRTW